MRGHEEDQVAEAELASVISVTEVLVKNIYVVANDLHQDSRPENES